ncbi:MAG TPA: biopolymer transporter ExbD [Nitrosospira sp.]|nr:biopolymer transporter ExbD [Nitrosospira sp.]
MNFQRGRQKEDPEINLVPMIDVLLVILIFLMITTTYSKFSELEINLPEAASEKPAEQTNAIDVGITATGSYLINGVTVKHTGSESLSKALREAAGNRSDPVIVIHADAEATHQSVIRVMEAARQAGYNHVTFSTENPA